MLDTDRPKLRSHLAARPADRKNQRFVIWDRLRLSDRQIRLSALEVEFAQMFDGVRTLRDVQGLAMQHTGGQIIPLEYFVKLATALDEALFLDGPRFRAAADNPVRKPSCIGCYEADPDALRTQFHTMFTGPGASGLPGETQHDPTFRGILAPHIDFARGGTTYTWAFKELVERSAAKLFVIIGTSHYSGHRFTLTRKHFETPLGIAPTDQAFCDKLVERYGKGLFDDELMAHLPEHSIELEVVLLQYLLAGRRDFRIVPLVVGSYHDCVEADKQPNAVGDVARMVEALRAIEAEANEPICYIISGDLAHIGPKFGDKVAVAEPLLTRSRQQDLALIDQASKANSRGYFQIIAAEGDARRICGLPPTYLALEVARPRLGKLLHYDQYVHPQGYESVSFASMAFYQ